MDGIEVVKQEAGKVMSWANGLVVSNDEQYKIAYDGVKQIKELRKRWTAFWAPLKKKAHETWKDVVAKEKEGTDMLDNADRTARQKAEGWRQEEERKAQAEQRRLQAIADEKARRERERLEKEAAKLKTPELKQERMEQAATVEAPVVTIERPVEAEGVSVRKVWKAQLVDMDKLIASAKPGSIAASFLEFNEKAANRIASSTKGSISVPGVEFYTERISAVRAKG